MSYIVEMKPDSVRPWSPLVECQTREQAQAFIDSELAEVAGEYRIVQATKTDCITVRGRQIAKLNRV